MDEVVHNPLADIVILDVKMIACFDKIFERSGLCLVGLCDIDNEPVLFNLL